MGEERGRSETTSVCSGERQGGCAVPDRTGSRNRDYHGGRVGEQVRLRSKTFSVEVIVNE